MLVSTRAAFGLAADMVRRQGIQDFGWRVADPRLNQMSPRLRSALYRSPTLFHALKRMCAGARGESSNVQFWLEEREDTVFLCHRGSLAVGIPGSDEASAMRTALILMVIRLFTDSNWVPPECALAMKGEIGPLVREALEGTLIWRTRDYGWIRLPRSMLANPRRILAPIEGLEEGGDGDEPALDLIGSLVQLLRPYLAVGGLSLRNAADLSGIPVRTLQRKLAHEGTSYRDIAQRVKFDAARELLKQPDIKVFQVACEMGFTDQANFNRFFRRFSGLTPRQYRTTLTENSI